MMIGNAIATVLSPLWMTPQLFFFTVYTLPLKTITKILSILGLPFDINLLAECAIIFYQYGMVAFIIGSTVGLANLLMFYILRELFKWLDMRLRWNVLGKEVEAIPIPLPPTKPKPSLVSPKGEDSTPQITIKDFKIRTELQSSKPEIPIKLPSTDTNTTTGASNKNFSTLHHRRPVSEETSTEADTTMFNVPASTITSLTEHSETELK